MNKNSQNLDKQIIVKSLHKTNIEQNQKGQIKLYKEDIKKIDFDKLSSKSGDVINKIHKIKT